MQRVWVLGQLMETQHLQTAMGYPLSSQCINTRIDQARIADDQDSLGLELFGSCPELPDGVLSCDQTSAELVVDHEVSVGRSDR